MSLPKLFHWFRRLDAWLLWPALGLVVWGELSPSDGNLEIWDKALHFVAYFGLALMATIAVRADRRVRWWVFALIALGGALEVVQFFIGRDADLLDEVANTLGVLAGWAVGAVGVRFLKTRKLVEDCAPD